LTRGRPLTQQDDSGVLGQRSREKFKMGTSTATIGIRGTTLQVSGFDDIGRLAPLQRLVSASCSSGQRFAFGLLQIRSRPRHPCHSAKTLPVAG